jgi:hypothetical protein
MANPRAFVSFDFDHDEIPKKLFVGQAKEDSPTPFTIEDWSSKSSLPQNEWENLVSNKINRCHLMIVLVGKSMGSAAGVAKEIHFAKAGNVPIFGVYVNGAGSSSILPPGLARNRVIEWKWAAVAAAINQMMGEGKNK